jgi:urease accessory protein UreH
MFGYNPLHQRIPATVLAELAMAGFVRTGEHNQRQSFFRKFDVRPDDGLQHIEIVENRPDELVVVYESATVYGDTLEPRRLIAGDTLDQAVHAAVDVANDASTVYRLSGMQALRQ